MKISVKLILLTGVIFLIVGVIGVKAALQTGDLQAGLTNVDLEKKIAGGDIQNLSIESDIAGVVFLPSKSDEIRVHLTGYASEERMNNTNIDAQLIGKDTWKVQVRTMKNFTLGLNISDIKGFIFMQEKKLRVEISLPQKAYDEINVTTNTGSIELPDIQSDKLNAKADTGSISVGKFQGKSINLQTDTGKIELKEGEGNVRMKTDTGSIDASLRSLGDSVNAQTDTGSIHFQLGSRPDSARFDISNDTGHIDFQVPDVKYEKNEKHSVKASIGGGSRSVRLQTDTGSIEVRE